MVMLAGAAVIWDPWGFNGFAAAKAATAAAGLALLALWLARHEAFVLPTRPWPAVAAALGALMLAATLASDSIWRSLLGAPSRLEGLIAWIGFGVAFAVGLSLARTCRDATAGSLVDAAVVAVSAVGAAGALEFAGVELNADLIDYGGRVRSTLANPAVLSGFLILVGPAAALAVARRGPWRWAGAAAVVLAVVNLAAAETRSAWLAVVVVCATASLLASTGRLRILVAAAALAVVAGASLSGRWQQLGHDLRGRAAIWEVAASSIAERPWLGHGPEMFITTYGRHVDDEAVREFGSTIIDSAHSDMLDFAASFGVIAAVLYLGALVCVVVLACGAVRSGDAFRAAIGIGVACYALMQQAFFAHISTDMVWWLMIGLLVADSGVTTRRLSRVGAALMLSAVSVLGVNALSSARNDRIIENSVESATTSDAYELLVQAASHRPFDDLSLILMGDRLSRASDIDVVNRGIGRIREGAEHNEGHPLVALALIDTHMQAHRLTSDADHAAQARLLASELIASEPSNGIAHLKRGIAAWYLDDLDAARSDWERAAFLIPERPEPRENLAVLDARIADMAGDADTG